MYSAFLISGSYINFRFLSLSFRFRLVKGVYGLTELLVDAEACGMRTTIKARKLGSQIELALESECSGVRDLSLSLGTIT